MTDIKEIETKLNLFILDYNSRISYIIRRIDLLEQLIKDLDSLQKDRSVKQ